MQYYTNKLEDQIIRLQKLLKDVIVGYDLTGNVGIVVIEEIKEELNE